MDVRAIRWEPVSSVDDLMWTPLTNAEQLERLILDSQKTPQFIFKHSTRCSISRVALSRFDRVPSPNEGATYFLLDLLQFRSLSQAITEQFGIVHESPQALLIRSGKCIYHANHLEIDPAEIEEKMKGF